MVRLSHASLVCTSLFTSILGAALSNLQSVDIERRKCVPGAKRCHDNIVFRCSSIGTWVGTSVCQYPAFCKEDPKTGNAGCVKPHVGEESKPDVVTAIPSPAPTLTSSHTRRQSPLGDCTEGDVRCGGAWEEICNPSGQWEQFRVCSECTTNDNGEVACVPSCIQNEVRCNDNREEMCDRKGEWYPVQECRACTEESGSTNCVPLDKPPSWPASHHHCHDGDLQCNGDWLEICYADRHWHRLVPCAQCSRSDDGGTFCSGVTPPPSAPPA
ncbi:hypothetical protein F5Y06DRAFT_307947 [Hypoxylon sp. FL0890]|nr:hypothetical protein F5Y06DRAFT_307947 [Hypoxylon sp. FL0890]